MLAFLLIPIVGQAQGERIKVTLEISADETIKPQVFMFMRNTLRGIRDVEVVDDSYYYKLKVAALKIRGGYSLSYIVLESVKPEFVKVVFKGTLSNISLKNYGMYDNEIYKTILKGIEEDTNIEDFSKNLSIARFHYLYAHYSLKDLCESAVAAFYNDVLEKDRNEIKMIRNMMKENEEKLKVNYAQKELNTSGFYDGPMDGIMGTKTRNAIKKYQESKGLPVTGEADKPTLDTLFSDAITKMDEKYNKRMEELEKRQKP